MRARMVRVFGVFSVARKWETGSGKRLLETKGERGGGGKGGEREKEKKEEARGEQEHAFGGRGLF